MVTQNTFFWFYCLSVRLSVSLSVLHNVAGLLFHIHSLNVTGSVAFVVSSLSAFLCRCVLRESGHVCGALLSTNWVPCASSSQRSGHSCVRACACTTSPHRRGLKRLPGCSMLEYAAVSTNLKPLVVSSICVVHFSLFVTSTNSAGPPLLFVSPYPTLPHKLHSLYYCHMHRSSCLAPSSDREV